MRNKRIKSPLETALSVLCLFEKEVKTMENVLNESMKQLDQGFKDNHPIKLFKRNQEKFTYRALAKYLGVSESYIGLIITGKRNCPNKIYRKLQKYLNQ